MKRTVYFLAAAILLPLLGTTLHADSRVHRVPQGVRFIQLSWHRQMEPDEIIQAAEAGDMYCQHYLATELEMGRGNLPQDAQQAMKWYQSSADQGFVPAMYRLASSYYQGDGPTPQDNAQALKWYRAAAEAGDAEAMFYLGVIFSRGELGVEADEAEAVKWFTHAAKLGEGYAIRSIREYETAKPIIAKAKSEEPEDIYEIAHFLEKNRYGNWRMFPKIHSGAYLEKLAENSNYATEWGEEAPAVGYFEKAAKMGYAPAMREFGLLRLGFRHSGMKDETDGVKYLQQAADASDADALLWLGICYAQGKGVQRDDVRAFQLLEQAEDQGARSAAEMLAYATLQGVGTEKNADKAVELLGKERFTDPGAPEYRLANIFLDLRDYPEAVRWLQRASDKGHDEAKLQLALCHLCGLGTPVNDTMAVTLLRESKADHADHFLYVCRLAGMASADTPKADAAQSVLLEKPDGLDDDVLRSMSALLNFIHLMRRDFPAAEKNMKIHEALLEKALAVNPDENGCMDYQDQQNATFLVGSMIPFYAAGWGTPRDEAKAMELVDQFMKILETEADPVYGDSIKYFFIAKLFFALDDEKEAQHWLAKIPEMDADAPGVKEAIMELTQKKRRENLLMSVDYGPCRQGPAADVSDGLIETLIEPFTSFH